MPKKLNLSAFNSPQLSIVGRVALKLYQPGLIRKEFECELHRSPLELSEGSLGISSLPQIPRRSEGNEIARSHFLASDIRPEAEVKISNRNKCSRLIARSVLGQYPD
jgi:hypothetical protein